MKYYKYYAKENESATQYNLIYLYKSVHICVSIVLQADNIYHIIGTSLHDLLSIPIVKWSLYMLNSNS